MDTVTIVEKMTFCFFITPKQLAFLTISNKFFFKTQGFGLGGKVAFKKSLEKALICAKKTGWSITPLSGRCIAKKNPFLEFSN